MTEIPSECPSCGELDPLYYAPEDADEDGWVECVECGWAKAIPINTEGSGR